jgi:hypothetical protein
VVFVSGSSRNQIKIFICQKKKEDVVVMCGWVKVKVVLWIDYSNHEQKK